MRPVIISVLLFGAAVCALGDDAPVAKPLPTLFVAPLEGDASQVMAWQPALGEGLAEMLITELGRLGKFQVLESTALKELSDEIKLGESGYVNEQERPNLMELLSLSDEPLALLPEEKVRPTAEALAAIMETL